MVTVTPIFAATHLFVRLRNDTGSPSQLGYCVFHFYSASSDDLVMDVTFALV